MKYIDTHAHLQDPRLMNQLNQLLDNADKAGVEKIIVVGYDLSSSEIAVNLTEHHQIFAGIGIHPHDAEKWNSRSYQQLKQLARQEKVVAIGEVGLDNYYLHSSPEIQKKVFNIQIELAAELNYPLIVHSRKAMAEVMEILENKNYNQVLLHSFEGNIVQAKQAVQKNYFLSFNGITTFKNSDRIQILKEINLKNTVVETDCPYLAPVPMRGKLNQPSFIPYINNFIAGQLGVDPQFTASTFYHNSLKFFKIDE
ncbi:MAG: TatD family hydrolase [bacterium]